MTKAEKVKLKKHLGDASSFLEALERGEMELEDLPDEIMERLQAIILSKKK
jgi:hypothetical protein